MRVLFAAPQQTTCVHTEEPNKVPAKDRRNDRARYSRRLVSPASRSSTRPAASGSDPAVRRCRPVRWQQPVPRVVLGETGPYGRLSPSPSIVRQSMSVRFSRSPPDGLCRMTAEVIE
jgi:hypothetical protein